MAALDTAYGLVIVHVVHRLRGRVLHSPRVAALQDKLSGVVLLLLGVRLALQER